MQRAYELLMYSGGRWHAIATCGRGAAERFMRNYKIVLKQGRESSGKYRVRPAPDVRG